VKRMTRSCLVALSIVVSGGVHAATPAKAVAKPVTAPATVPQSSPKLAVYKDPTCGCCEAWVEHMKKNGFDVSVNESADMNSVKKSAGIPAAMGSCHTGKVGKYFIEGHVPAADVKRLLAANPDALGLTVPGMPAGSPGMEVPSGLVQPYDVYLVHKDGTTSVWRHYEGNKR
jgi:hypothetical protein